MIKSLLIVNLCLIGASVAILGGWENIEIDRDIVKKLTGLAVENRNSETDSLYYRNVAEVTSARGQVVNGVKYEVKLVLGETHCARADTAGKLCPVVPDGFKEACVYTFYLAPVFGDPQIIAKSCTTIQ